VSLISFKATLEGGSKVTSEIIVSQSRYSESDDVKLI
jgi:hypothetical protein